MSQEILSGRPAYVREAGPGEWKLLVWAQPGAKKNEPVGVYQDRLKIRLQAPAVDNKANKALIAYVARLLGLKKSQVSLCAGRAARAKTLEIRTEKEPGWDALAT